MKLISLLNNFNNKVAIVNGCSTYTYRDVWRNIGKLINYLNSKNFKPRQRVVLIIEHDEVAIFLIAAASALNLQIVIPYNLKAASYEEWDKIIIDSKPEHIIYIRNDCSLINKLKAKFNNLTRLQSITDIEYFEPNSEYLTTPLPSVKDFLVLFTSGTTGNPKAISISEELICERVVRVSSKLKFTIDSRILMSGLMNNTTGFIFSFGSLTNNSTLFIPKENSAESWPHLVQKKKLTHLMLRPIALKNFIRIARSDNVNLASLNVVAYGAAALPIKTLEESRKLIPCEWIQGYGLSETFGPFSWLDEDDHKSRVYEKYSHCVGKPDDSLNVYTIKNSDSKTNIGQIALQGKHIMRGYLDFKTNTISSCPKLFLTGDYGYITEEGFLVIKGRIKDDILSKNGYKLHPQEMESSISCLKNVSEVVILHLTEGNDIGDDIVIYIHTEKQNIKDTIIHNVMENLRRKFSLEKLPNYLYLDYGAVPTNHNGKISKELIRKKFNKENLIQLIW